MIDAVSFSEAETRIYKILEPYIKGDLEIKALSKANIADVFDFDDDGVWYKSKITYLDVDPDTEKKKKMTQYVLVRASDVKQAYERTEENLSLLVPYDIPSVQETSIIDVFPYERDEEKELEGRNVRPLKENETKAETGDQEENNVDQSTGEIIEE